jgi:hypothetical protein
MYNVHCTLYKYTVQNTFRKGPIDRGTRPKDVHRKKWFTSFPSPAGMSLTKLPLGRNNSVMTSLFPSRESLVVTSRLGTGNSRSFFYGVVTSQLGTGNSRTFFLRCSFCICSCQKNQRIGSGSKEGKKDTEKAKRAMFLNAGCSLRRLEASSAAFKSFLEASE